MKFTIEELEAKLKEIHKKYIKTYNDNVLLTAQLKDAKEALEWYSRFDGETARASLDYIEHVIPVIHNNKLRGRRGKHG